MPYIKRAITHNSSRSHHSYGPQIRAAIRNASITARVTAWRRLVSFDLCQPWADAFFKSESISDLVQTRCSHLGSPGTELEFAL